MSPCMYGFMLSKTNKYVVHGKKKKKKSWVYGQGRENEGIKGKEAIVSEPKKPQERKGDVNMKLWERKFDEEERKQIMNNDFDTEEVWDDDVHNLEGGKTNQIVS